MKQSLTKEQALIITGFTGILCCPFNLFHEDVEKRLGRSVWTHEFGSKEFSAELKDVYREDFMATIYKGE
ncbi:hypothetical protein [Cronobacter phage EspYZU12]|uniref:Uncharacterized protein 155 n=2 Tax=Seunavirus TaxID=1914851 RepID=G3BM21_9CAUD|nr:hypothetical protein PVP-SE1_gp155 [Salmonella phage PVPSE1]YP_009148968.1 hypothetical protein ACQ19_gp172 [Salmonella phage SSE121]WAK43640.1 hypothetical protein EspYZU15_140 [Cronobacter phage EspYZU15]WAK45546.1 hypothetical protein EspYZU14_142 [Cronobacter phage EspYZU14]WBF78330.1 hypothetical protein [Cronobacter phage EspYZU12]ADP02551.1 hypothetical protein [Salmonella phage PVPSE1]AFU63813.1 hypothetical protein [Salmonella phage SSE121]